MRHDDAKDAGEGAIVLSTTYASTGSLTATALAAAAVVFKLGFNAIVGRDTKRAEELFARMEQADEDPVSFRAHLEDRINREDEEVLSALRTLIAASLEALSPGAVALIAMLGRQYVRKETPAWIIRAWVRVVAELESDELDVLRQIAGAFESAMQAGAEDTRKRQPEIRTDRQDLALLLSEERPGYGDIVGYPRGLVVMTSHFGYSGRVATDQHADRFFELLAHHGVASRRETFVARHKEHVKDYETSRETRPAIELRHATAIAIIRAFRPAAANPMIGL